MSYTPHDGTVRIIPVVVDYPFSARRSKVGSHCQGPSRNGEGDDIILQGTQRCKQLSHYDAMMLCYC